MSIKRVTATKHNLLETKKQLDVILSIRRILEDRKDIQLDMLKKALEEVSSARQKMNASLSAAYDSLALSAMTMGRDKLDRFLPQTKALVSIRSSSRRIAGKEIFGAMLETVTVEPSFGFLDTSGFLDEFLGKMQQALWDVFHLAEAENLLFRLIHELRSTQRLINVLDHFIIPDYQSVIKHIDSKLEEDEREEFIRLKIIKSRMLASKQ